MRRLASMLSIASTADQPERPSHDGGRLRLAWCDHAGGMEQVPDRSERGFQGRAAHRRLALRPAAAHRRSGRQVQRRRVWPGELPISSAVVQRRVHRLRHVPDDRLLRGRRADGRVLQHARQPGARCGSSTTPRAGTRGWSYAAIRCSSGTSTRPRSSHPRVTSSTPRGSWTPSATRPRLPLAGVSGLAD
jgi:hypothetical protein